MKSKIVDKKVLSRAVSILAATDAYELDIKNGTINVNLGESVFISAKTDMDFLTGSVHAQEFVSCIKSIKNSLVEIRVKGNKLILRPDSHKQTELYYSPGTKDEPEIDLWDNGIEWHTCPGDLFEGIRCVGVACEHINGFQNVHVAGRYVIGESDYKCCRYNLSNLAPFNMNLPWLRIRNIMSNVKVLKLKRAAKYVAGELSKMDDGFAFDFGDIRIWISKIGYENPAYDKHSGQINEWFKIPSAFLVELPKDVRNYLKIFTKFCKPFDVIEMEIVTIKKGKGEIRVHYDGEANDNNDVNTLDETIPVKIYGNLKSIKMRVNSLFFCSIVKGKCLMGYIPLSRPDDYLSGTLYVKNRRCEYLINTMY